MGLFSFFTLKSDTKKAFSKENVKEFLDFARGQIITYVPEAMKGSLKKERVDAACLAWLNSRIRGINSIIDWLLDNLIPVVLPILTQLIYECLEDRIQGLTRA